MAPIALLFSALAVRLVSWPLVYQPDGVQPFGYDAFYHLRRIRYSIENFPASLTWDPFINFPNGGQPIWPPTFDWLLAAVFRLVPGIDQPERLERIAMWVPPLLGAATVAIVALLGSRVFSRKVALLAAGILCVLPAHFYYSRVGFVDHHVLEALLTTLLLLAAMRLLSDPEPDGGGEGAMLRRSGLLGLSMAACLLVWPGSLIHVGIVQVGLVGRLLGAKERAAAVAWAQRFAFVHLVACAAVLPLCVGNEWQRWGHLSPLVLSGFQPLYLLSAAASFGVLALGWRSPRVARTRATRAGVAIALAASLLACLLAALPELRAAPFDALAWLVKLEAFQAVVSESTPLFATPGADPWRPVQLFTAFIYVVPLAVLLLGWQLRRRADLLFFLWWMLALYAATLLQWRFMNSYAIAHSLLMALTVRSLYRIAAPRLGLRPRLRWAAAGLAIAALLVGFSPVLDYYRLHLFNLRRALAGQPPWLSDLALQTHLVTTTARWLRENSPAPEGAGYSVMGPWGDGHILQYVAERPVVQDNFGDDVALEGVELAKDYFAARSEETALSILERTRSRYVLVRPGGSGHRSDYARDSMFARLYRLRGSQERRPAATSDPSPLVPALQRHRLVYESPPFRRRPGSFCKVFEVVEGARLVGRADPDATVEASLGVTTRYGGRLDYVTVARADAAGRYALRLPYPSQPFSPDVRVDRHYRIRGGEASATFVLSEAAVRGGAEVEGPSLRTTPEDAAP